ncbi:unnamed protein product [Blepharisma stoltei]|uniref:Beige/BEACH domain containing protein n=1 Tax=Blepharisma stoltei TaxID=1481888 RepID=A0AAU9I963_9CILI|nr:unnamed protein product [Blepharisma stoltei]
MESTAEFPPEIYEIIKPVLEFDQIDPIFYNNCNVLEALIAVLRNKPSPSVLCIIEGVMGKAISNFISPKHLKILMSLIYTNSAYPELQESILRSIYQGLNTFIEKETNFTEADGKERWVKPQPNRYFFFNGQGNFAQCSCPKETFAPKKEFSFFVWVFVDQRSINSCIAEFSEGKDQRFSIFITKEFSVGIKLSNLKTIFKVESEKKLENNQWNMIGFSIRKILGFRGKKDELLVFVNSDYPSKIKKKKQSVMYPNFEISVITIGNTSDLNKPFQGKIASMYISDKFLPNHYFSLVHEASNKLSIDYNPSYANNKLIIREFWNSLIFQWNSCRKIPISNFKNFNACGWQWIHSVNIFDSLNISGGLKLWIPIITKCNTQGIIWIIKILSALCQVSNYFESQCIPFNNFFENFGVALGECNIDPSQEFLYACIELIKNLEWSRPNKASHNFQYYYQIKAFNSIFLNKPLWINLVPSTIKDYLKFLAEQIPLHFTFSIKEMPRLFIFLITAEAIVYKEQDPLLEEEYYNSILLMLQRMLVKENKIFNTEAFIGILMKMAESEGHITLLEKFLQFLYYFKISLPIDKFNELYMVMLNLLEEHADNSNIHENLIRLMIELVLKVTQNTTDVGKTQQIAQTLYIDLERCLHRDISFEVFASIMRLVTIMTENFKNFIDLITTRIPKCENLLDKAQIIENLNKTIFDIPGFSLTLHDRLNFPQWLIESYTNVKDPSYLDRFAVNIFSNIQNLLNYNNLRTFMFGIADNISYEKSLDFFLLLLHNIDDKLKNNIRWFLELLGVLEDLLNPAFIETEPIISFKFRNIINEIVKAAKDLKLLSLCQPNLPAMNFSTLNNLFNETRRLKKYDKNALYLRDGGFIRFILKFIFISLDFEQNDDMVEALQNLVKFWSEKHSSKFPKKEPQKFERLTKLYGNYPKDSENIFSINFIILYVFAECTEIISQNNATTLLVCFLSKLIIDCNVCDLLQSMLSSLTSEDLANFHNLQENLDKHFHSTSRSHYPLNLRNKVSKAVLENLRNTSPIRYSGAVVDFYINDQNQVEEFKKTLNREIQRLSSSLENLEVMRQVLASEDWIKNVHLFLLAYTSMKVNFLGVIVPNFKSRYTDIDSPYSGKTYHESTMSSSYVDRNDETKIYDVQFDEYIKSIGNSYNREKGEIALIEKEFAQKMEYDKIFYLKQNKSINKIMKTFLTNSLEENSNYFSVMNRCDGLGRMPFLKEWSKEKLSTETNLIASQARVKGEVFQRKSLLDELENSEELSRNLSLLEQGISETNPSSEDDSYNSIEEEIIDEIKEMEFSDNENEGTEPATPRNLPVDFELQAVEDQQNTWNANIDLRSELKYSCARVKVKGIYQGMLKFKNNYMIFTNEQTIRASQASESSANLNQYEKDIRKIWNMTEIREIFARRFVYNHSAIEFFLKSGKTLYFNLFEKEICDSVLDFLTAKLKRHGALIHRVYSGSALRRYTTEWRNGSISNFEYLLILNKHASRSFNDLSQYPIFPWILNYYNSKNIKFEDPGIYRDLKLPVGAQNEERKTDAIRRYEMCSESGMPPFHYGTHYSNGGLVLHYLERIEPYTAQAKKLHGWKFDLPDRQFISLINAWDGIINTTGDIKELIPELFYLSEIFVNLNNLELGARQDGTQVGDVELPTWSKSQYDFIVKHKKALESAYVSENLNHWIDLIFGYKQAGKSAVESLNVYFATTYEDNFNKIMNNSQDQEFKETMKEQAIHFGQTPIQLFKRPHPAKKDTKEKYKPCSIIEKIKNSVTNWSEPFNSYGRVIAMLASQKFFVIVKFYDNKIILLKFKCKGDLKIDFSNLKETELEGTKYMIDESLIENSIFYILKEENIASGGYIDNTFKIHSFDGYLIGSYCYHVFPVSAIAITKSKIITGSIDTSIISWKLGPSISNKIKRENSHYIGHISEIKKLIISEDYQILISLGSDNTVIVHNLRNSECLRKFQFSQLINEIAFSDLGLIVAGGTDGVIAYTLNGGDLKIKSRAKNIKHVEINSPGDALLMSSQNGVAVLELFNNTNDSEYSLSEEFSYAKFSTLQDYLICYQNRNDNFIVSTLE